MTAALVLLLFVLMPVIFLAIRLEDVDEYSKSVLSLRLLFKGGLLVYLIYLEVGGSN